MIVMQGKGVSAGVALGPLYFYQRAEADVSLEARGTPEAEWARFTEAQENAMEQLGALAEQARQAAGEEAATLFETHQMMAEDLDYVEAIEDLIRNQGFSAEGAVRETGDQFSEMFAAMDDDYMQARAADVKDVSRRILACLTGAVQGGIDSPIPVILAADDLSPSETVQLDKTKVLAFLTSGGAESGHTAILARTMGIPAIIGLGADLLAAAPGTEVLVDGETGQVLLTPEDPERARLLEKQARLKAQDVLRRKLRGQPSVTRDGQQVRICCNIGAPGDVPAVLDNDGEGIGLFRSEFLYLSAEDFPSEEVQFQAYRQVLEQMQGREVIIRTMDIGADKQIGYFGLPAEENPALGNRALRICLSRPEIFRTQLRALYRASAYGKLCIMFPMVASVWEVREAKAHCEAVRQELEAEGIPVAEHVPVGIMIETPAAAVISDRLAKVADFFSCGTNDLTQYTLACDRQNSGLGRFFDPHHPALLRLLRHVTENAHRNGIWVGICGELAADPALTETFLALGIDELSVSPRSVLPLRQRVRDADVSSFRDRILTDLLDSEAL